jgi:hypothetical protein
MVWMTPGVYVCTTYTACRTIDLLVLFLGDNFDTKLFVFVLEGTATAVATATCEFLLRLLPTCQHDDLYIQGANDGVPTPMSGAALSVLFQENRDNLRKVTVTYMTLSEDQCLVMATMSRLDVEIILRYCYLADNAAGAFVACLHTDRGPVKVYECKIDNQILARALAGDSRVTRLKIDYRAANDADMAIWIAALANNRGLVDLDFQSNFISISNENWSILCESLKAHPTLTSLDLNSTYSRRWSTEDKAHRTSLLAETMKENTVLRTIRLPANERNEQIYTSEIHPHLETNLYRPRVLIVKKTIEITFREKVLGRALYCVRSNPNLVWMFLSENVDAFVRWEEEESNSEVPVVVAAAVVVALADSKRKR